MNKVIMLAEGPTASTAAESLAEHVEVCALFRKPMVAEAAIETFAASRSIPLIRDTSLQRIGIEIDRVRPACVVISSYDRLVPRELLKLTRFVNVHYGPLPGYRGRANVNWAILNHESEASITVHVVDSDLDSGNILFQGFVPITGHSTVTEIYDRLNEIQRRELGSVVVRHIAGYTGFPQVGAASYCCTRVPQDGEISWDASTRDIYALIRALALPYPGAYSFFRKQKIIITKALPVSEAPNYVGRISGRVCGVDLQRESIDVLTGDGVLRIYQIVDELGVSGPVTRLIRSTKDTLGLTTFDLLERIRQLESLLGHAREDDAGLPASERLNGLERREKVGEGIWI